PHFHTTNTNTLPIPPQPRAGPTNAFLPPQSLVLTHDPLHASDPPVSQPHFDTAWMVGA
ncbi:hypothetical protein DM02DRAFT_482645, partial [Periconia macrospinosa]